MAQQDYIKRAKPKNNKAKAKSNDPLFLMKIGLTSLAVLGFAYFLWSIKGAAKQAPQPQAPQPTVVQPKNELPVPPKTEKWQYVDELKNKEVEVEVKKIESKGPYLLQCASLRSEDAANGLKARIAFAGLESEVRKTNGGRWHKVVLGPFDTKRHALKAKNKLKRSKIYGCLIRPWT